MGRTIDQIRASKLPSNMMQFAARGAMQVPPAENIEILVYLARHNKVFGDLARMTLAGWDEKASIAAASNPETSREVLDYMISPDNVRPKLLPALLENPSIPEEQLAKFALSALRESIETMLQSPRVRGSSRVLSVLKSNPYLKKEDQIDKLLGLANAAVAGTSSGQSESPVELEKHPVEAPAVTPDDEASDVPDETVSTYLAEHAPEIAAEEGKPFQAIGGSLELLGQDYFPVTEVAQIGTDAVATPAAGTSSASPASPSQPSATAVKRVKPPVDGKRDNAMQKINKLDVKGRIQLALKGNKEERSLLIRDGTKVVALAVLDAPKLSDGEVEKFASQKNVLEAVLRQIPLKRRFMKNYIVVRNLVANPRTPLDLGLGLMKNLLIQDLKNLSANKEVSDTIRKLATKMFKQKLEASSKK